jgi:hypothetical protein
VAEIIKWKIVGEVGGGGEAKEDYNYSLVILRTADLTENTRRHHCFVLMHIYTVFTSIKLVFMYKGVDV